MFHTPFKRRLLATAIAATLPHAAHAVSVDGDGVGQALIYPYYTVRDGRAGTFNTYLSVVNPTQDAKALRVRFREGRNGKPVGNLNLYLGPNDVWTAAMVPSALGTTVLSGDMSCTDPVVGDGSPGRLGFDLTNAAFDGINDAGAGDTLDRTREGYIEVFEMATLTGASRTATVPINGRYSGCAALASIPPAEAGAPTGGLSGSLTLINVADGSDYSVNATALADVFKAPLHRPVSDPYPGFDAAEVSTVSFVAARGALYRSEWPTGVDAVNAALATESFASEYVLDYALRGTTGFMLAFPTRSLSGMPGNTRPPFRGATTWSAGCINGGEVMDFLYADREQGTGLYDSANVILAAPVPPLKTCGTVAFIEVLNAASSTTMTGSTLGGMNVMVRSTFQNGQFRGTFTSGTAEVPAMTSLPSSTRVDIATGAVKQGAHIYTGLPVVGFMIRSLKNGTLDCGGTACQGNYGGAFPLRMTRSVTAN